MQGFHSLTRVLWKPAWWCLLTGFITCLSSSLFFLLLRHFNFKWSIWQPKLFIYLCIPRVCPEFLPKAFHPPLLTCCSILILMSLRDFFLLLLWSELSESSHFKTCPYHVILLFVTLSFKVRYLTADSPQFFKFLILSGLVSPSILFKNHMSSAFNVT